MCEISAKEFNRRLKTGEYIYDKRGRLKEQKLLPEFKQMLDDDTQKSKENIEVGDKVLITIIDELPEGSGLPIETGVFTIWKIEGNSLYFDETELIGLISEVEKVYKPKSENKKIKGATKCEWKGIKFDSHLEMYFYIYLTDLKIPFIHQSKYLLQEGFKFNGKSIRPITWTPDFDFGTFIIDTKGHPTQQVQLRIKMFLYKYRIPVYIFKTKKDFNKIHELWKNYRP